jgi:hypothetical protein
LHPAGRIDQNDIKIIVSTIGNRLLGDSSRILSIAPFKEFNMALTSGRPIDAEHAQIANMHAKLFYCTAPTRLIFLQYKIPESKRGRLT